MLKINLVSLLLLLPFLFISCSSGPSEREIQKAVIISLQHKVPAALAQHLTGGKNAKVKEVKVIEIGNVQGEGTNQYWPVKIYAKGTCKVMFGGRKSFEGETEYYIKIDAYGNWIASHKGF